jgi:hypothetical protein
MIKLLFGIYSYSFDALVKFKQDDINFDKWVDERKRFNFSINTLVFSYIGDKFKGRPVTEESFRQQFCLDVINGILKKHLVDRIRIFKFSNKFPFLRKHIFEILSIYFTLVQAFRRIAISLLNCNKRFSIADDIYCGKVDICIGFPKHAFSYNPHGFKYPKSFIEFVQSTDTENAMQTSMLSLDEYERPSKKFETEKTSYRDLILPSDFPRKGIYIKADKQNIITTIFIFFKVFKTFATKVGKVNLFLLADYLNQFIIDRRYRYVFEEISARKIKINKIYVIDFLDIGLLKYDKYYNNLISVFSYSQNSFIPPSNEIMRNMLNHTTEFRNETFLEECDLPIFSFYLTNIIGFSYNRVLINNFKSYINKCFGLVLPNFVIDTTNTIPINLGYESFKTLELERSVKTVLVFDVPGETDEENLGRSIIGDKTARNAFILSFHTDIFYLLKKYNCKILLKPKYSLSSPKLPDEYKSMIISFQKEMGALICILDPYTNIRVSQCKIDLMISFPFTSTYYSMADVCERSIYYVSDTYRESFSQTLGDKLVLGRLALENIIKQL